MSHMDYVISKAEREMALTREQMAEAERDARSRRNKYAAIAAAGAPAAALSAWGTPIAVSTSRFGPKKMAIRHMALSGALGAGLAAPTVVGGIAAARNQAKLRRFQREREQRG